MEQYSCNGTTNKKTDKITILLFNCSAGCGWRTLNGNHCYGCCRCSKNSRQQRRCWCRLLSAQMWHTLWHCRHVITDSYSVSAMSIWLDWGSLIWQHRRSRMAFAWVDWVWQTANCGLFLYSCSSISYHTVTGARSLPEYRNRRLACLLCAIWQAALSKAGVNSIRQISQSICGRAIFHLRRHCKTLTNSEL